MDLLSSNLRVLCDDMRMLTGLSVSYGTQTQSEQLTYGRAQEVVRQNGQYVSSIRPLIDNSIYDLASLTKLFTAITALRLTELGLLSLDTFVAEIEPRFVHLQHVTVQDVLCFRACLQTDGRIDEASDREEGLRRLFASRVVPSPAVRLYSDINAMVIKYIIQAKTGRSLFDAIRTFILTPAGMHETYATVPQTKLSRCVCYSEEHRIVHGAMTVRTDPPLGCPHDPKAYLLSPHGENLCGHAGLFSTLQDMIRLAQALLSGCILSPKTLLDMATDRTGRRNADGTYRQSLGYLCFTKHPIQSLSEVPAYMGPHAMGISGFTGNHFVLDPQTGCFEVFLGNRCHNRISHITPFERNEDYGLDANGAGRILWTDGRLVPTSARYVYLKDRLLHEPIAERMQELGWLTV